MTFDLDLGPWGVDLDDSAYGRALAALGVTVAATASRTSLDQVLEHAADPAFLRKTIDDRPQVPWGIARVTSAGAPAWARAMGRRPGVPSGAAAAWATAVEGRAPDAPVRLAIERYTTGMGAYRWLTDQLLQPRVGVAPAVVATELESAHRWHWPLRIGVFDDPASRAFIGAVGEQPWSAALWRVVRVDRQEAADLLVMPQDLTSALAMLATLTGPVDVGCVVVLGGLGGHAETPIDAVLGALRLRARPWGLTVANVPPGAEDRWFSGLLFTLSHDAPLDVALTAAPVPDRRWLLVAEPGQLAGSRVSHAAERLVRAMPPDPGFHVDTLPESVVVAFALPPEPTAEDLGQAAINPANYEFETRGAAATAALARDHERRRAAKPVRGKPRFIQVDVREGSAYRGRSRRTALAPDTLFGVDVWIGPDSGSIRAEAPLPEDQLPRDRETHDITVVFTELGGRRRTSTGRIELPPAGASTRHRFFFRTPAEGTFRARLLVAYRNRVLQSAVLAAPVRVATAGRADSRPASRIRIEIEAVVRPGLAELKGRSAFNVALVHNHDEHGAASGTAIRGGDAVSLDLGGIGPTVERITALLSDAARDADAYGPTIEATPTVGLLFKLAHQGVLLHDDLTSRSGFADLVGGAERIQVLAADPNAILPLEFVYDLPAPARPPKLCPNARQSLLDGQCADVHHVLDEEGHLDVVCPSGFWAMQRVIERHVADPEGMRAAAGGAAYSIDAEPVRDRDTLAGLSGALFAASSRVDAVKPGSTGLVEAALAAVTDDRATRVRTWREWVQAAGRDAPSLLVILAHSARDAVTGTTALEIEADERRDASEINRRFLGPDTDGFVPPLVFLLGCDTAVADLQYQTFVSRFRQTGAALVVGTIATVAGAHAAGVAAELARALRDVDPATSPAFGDVLRQVRRRLLADGEVMALCLTAYGDADWRLPPRA